MGNGEESEMENVAMTNVRKAENENEDENDSMCYQNCEILQSNMEFETGIAGCMRANKPRPIWGT